MSEEVGEVGRGGQREEVEGAERHCGEIEAEIEVEVDICFGGQYVSSANGL